MTVRALGFTGTGAALRLSEAHWLRLPSMLLEEVKHIHAKSGFFPPQAVETRWTDQTDSKKNRQHSEKTKRHSGTRGDTGNPISCRFVLIQ